MVMERVKPVVVRIKPVMVGVKLVIGQEKPFMVV